MNAMEILHTCNSKRLRGAFGSAALLLGAVLLLGSCSREPEPEPNGNGDGVLMNFTLDGFAPATRAALDEGTTVRVVALKPQTSTRGTYVADQAYYMVGDRLVPCTVDADGANPKPITLPWEGMRLNPSETYRFVAITPALPVETLEQDFGAQRTYIAHAITNGMDFAHSQTDDQTFTQAEIDAGVRTQTLNPLRRELCGLLFEVTLPKESGETISSIKVEGLPKNVAMTDNVWDMIEIHDLYLSKDGIEGGTGQLLVPKEAFRYNAATLAYMTDRPQLVLPVRNADEVIEWAEPLTADLTITLTVETADGYTESVSDVLTVANLMEGTTYLIHLERNIKPGGGISFVAKYMETVNSEVDMGKDSYPYVRGGNTIVFRDGNGYASGYVYHGPWTFTPTHTESSDWQGNASGLNTVSASFEVASGDCGGSRTYTYAEALTACDGLWRLPTIRELAVMADMRGELTVGGISAESNYWSATARNGSNSYACKLIKGNKPGWNGTGSYNRVRCVRDL